MSEADGNGGGGVEPGGYLRRSVTPRPIPAAPPPGADPDAEAEGGSEEDSDSEYGVRGRAGPAGPLG